MAIFLGKLRGKDLTDESPIEELEEAALWAEKMVGDLRALGQIEASERVAHSCNNLQTIIFLRKAVA